MPCMTYVLLFIMSLRKNVSFDSVTDHVSFFGLGFMRLMLYMSHVMTKPVSGVSDEVQHKLGSTATENG